MDSLEHQVWRLLTLVVYISIINVPKGQLISDGFFLFKSPKIKRIMWRISALASKMSQIKKCTLFY